MWQRTKIWVHNHPWLFWGLLGLVVLYFVVRAVKNSAGSSDGGGAVYSGGPSEGLQAAQLQAGVQSQGIQATAIMAGNKNAADVAQAQLAASTAVEIGKAQRDVALQSILTAGEVAVHGQNTDLATARANIGGQVTIAGIGADTTRYVAATQADVANHQISAARDVQLDVNATQLGLAGIAADVTKSSIQLAANEDAYNYNRDIYAIKNQTQVQRDAIYYGAQVTNAQTAAGEQVARDKIYYDSQTNNYAITKGSEVALSNLDLQKFITQTGGDVAKLNIKTQGDVAKTAITTQGRTNLAYIGAQKDVSLADIAARFGIDSKIIAGLDAGEYGNANRAALASTILNPSGSSAVAIEQGGGVNGFMNGIANIVHSVFGNGGVAAVLP